MDTAKKIDIARTITKAVVGVSVGTTVTALIKDQASDDEQTRINRAKTVIAAWALSGVAAHYAVVYAEKQFNKSVGAIADLMAGKAQKPTTTA